MTATTQTLPAPAPRRAFFFRKHSVLPGFKLTFGFTLFYLSLVVLVPLSTLFARSAALGPAGFWATTLFASSR